jgi:FlaA1/EpsC-like NDP-sugar epimerase
MNKYRNIIIIGAGNAGKLLSWDIKKNHSDCKIIGFVDDEKEGNGIKILGKIDELSKINKIYKVDEMVIAIPSASGNLIRRILMNNLKNRVSIKIVPRDQKIISLNDVHYDEIRNLKMEDFLGRPFVKKNIQKLKSFYKNKKVLITGGAGSIGSEIVRQLLDLDVKNIVVYDNSEYLTFNLDQHLKEQGVGKSKYKLIIGNILNYKKVDYVIKKEKPDIIFHAAAYKHVYLMEDNISESIQANVGGTKGLVDIAIRNGVSQFIFISTDKVVNPSSIMGATKKLGEYYIKSLDTKKTNFGIVRFGNVINSNGSVLPLFDRQITEHRYVTITHKKIERFFMSIREAAQLVITSAARDTDGDIHILNMEELIKIYEVAQCLIRSKGLIPEKDVEMKIIGLKKGEKMIEELFTDVEESNLIKTENEDIFRLKNFEECPVNIQETIDELVELASSYPNENKIKKYIKNIFPSLKLG